MVESSIGVVTVSGAGSSWTNSSWLRVGNNGDGALTIEDGGAVSNTDGFIAYSSSSTGAATVSGAGFDLEQYAATSLSAYPARHSDHRR